MMTNEPANPKRRAEDKLQHKVLKIILFVFLSFLKYLVQRTLKPIFYIKFLDASDDRTMTPVSQQDQTPVQERDLSNVVQGTAETLLNKLEETVAATSISNRGIPFGRALIPGKKGK